MLEMRPSSGRHRLGGENDIRRSLQLPRPAPSRVVVTTDAPRWPLAGCHALASMGIQACRRFRSPRCATTEPMVLAVTTPTPLVAPQPAASPKPVNKTARTAFIISIIAFVLGCIWFLGFVSWIPAVVAVVLAIVGLARPHLPKGFAIAGLIIGLVALVAGPATAITNVVSAASGSPDPNTAAIAPAEAPTRSARPTASAATTPAAVASSITVPNVVGKEGDVAKATIKEANLVVDFDAGNDVVLLSSNWTVTGQTPAPGTKVAADSTVTLKVVKTSTITAGETSASAAPAAPAVPAEYLNALASAQSYSDNMNMSKQGIFDQLTSSYGDQFTKAAAQYGVDHVKADWNANALAKAKDYESQQHMSPAAIHDQLTSSYGEQFTQAQADYAIKHLND